MKKILITCGLSCFAISSLYANDSAAYKEEKTVKKEVVVTSSKSLYNVALKNFRAKKYEKAYEQFNSLFLTNMGDVLTNFYLGRSAYELGKYEFALSAYDRILIVQPENTRVRLEMAQTYFKMKLYTQAISEFNLVLEDKKIPSNVRKNVEAKIKYMQNLQKKHYVNATAIAGILYDSNINSTPTTGVFDIYNPTVDSIVTVTNNDKEESSTIYQAVGQINHIYKYSDNFILNSSATALLMKYINHKEKDIQALSLSVTPTILQKKYKVSLPILFDKINLGHESYQNNIYFNPNYSRILSDTMLYTTGVKVGRVTFVKDKDRDVNLYEWQNSLRVVSQKYGLFTFGLDLGKEVEVRSVRTDVDHKYFNTYFNNSYELSQNYTLQTAINYKEYNYSDVDVNFQSKKKDKKTDISMSILRPLGKEFVLNIGGTYTDKNSNHASSEYDKYVIKANLIWNTKVH